MKVVKGILICYLALAMVILGMPRQTFAAFSSSQLVAFSQAEKSSEIQKIQKFLETKMVRERLAQLGFTPEEVGMKLAGLNDAQVHRLALQLDEIKVGGSTGEVVVIVLLVALLAVLIIYVSGHKIVFR